MAVKQLYFSRRMAKEREAVAAFNDVMKPYGLQAERYTGGHFNQNQTIFHCELETKWFPVKGSGKIMTKLKEDGWNFSRKMGHDSMGYDRMMFRVYGYCDIHVTPDDLLEYCSPADIADILPLVIRKER